MVDADAKKGFTLVELLATIIIVAVIFAITIPSVSNVIRSSTKKAFSLDVQRVIEQIKDQHLKDFDFDETNINASNMKEILNISDSNYEFLYASRIYDEYSGYDYEPTEVYIYAVGKNKWKGLVAQGTYSSITVSDREDCKDVETSIGYLDVAIDESNYVVVGMEGFDFEEFNENSNAVIIKHDSEGNVLWKNTFFGSDSDLFNKVITVDDGYIVVGSSASNDGYLEDMNKGSSDAIIVKYDKSGNILWKKNFGGSYSDEFYSIAKTTDGFIAVGSSYSRDDDLIGVSINYENAIIVKYDDSGNILWKKTFGGNEDDRFNSIIETTNGYIVVGESESTTDDMNGLNKGSSDAIIVKYDYDGNVVWKNVFGGSDEDSFNSITETTDGYVVVGQSESTTDDMNGLNKGSFDAVIVKYDYDGNVVWKNVFGGSSSDSFTSITKTPNGFAITGTTLSHDGDLAFESDGFSEGKLVLLKTVLTDNYNMRSILVKTEEDGTIAWQKDLDVNGVSFPGNVASDGSSLFATGYSYQTSIKPIFSKYNLNSELIWKKNDFQTINVCQEYDVCMLKPINRYDVVQSSITIDSTGYAAGGTQFGMFMNDLDPLLTKYDKNGKILWDKKISLGTPSLLLDIKTVDNDYVTITFNYYGTQFLIRFDSNGNKVWEAGTPLMDIYQKIYVNSSGIILTGIQMNMEFESESSIITCFDFDGKVVWRRYLDEKLILTSLVSTNDGYLITGNSNEDAVTIKYDLDGQVVWKKTYDIGMEEEFMSATVSDTGYIVVGKAIDIDGVETGIIVKYCFDGNIIWEKQLNEGSALMDAASISDGYIVVGYNDSNKPLIIRYNENDIKVWEKNYSGFEGSFKNVVIRNGNITVLGGNKGHVEFSSGAGSPEIVSYDLNGNYKWSNIYKKDQMELICNYNQNY